MLTNPFHPGEILLEEYLIPAKLTQTAFAKKIGWTRPRLNGFIKGRYNVTAAMALDLAEVTRTTAKFWMSLQSTWDLVRVTKSRKQKAA